MKLKQWLDERSKHFSNREPKSIHLGCLKSKNEDSFNQVIKELQECDEFKGCTLSINPNETVGLVKLSNVLSFNKEVKLRLIGLHQTNHEEVYFALTESSVVLKSNVEFSPISSDCTQLFKDLTKSLEKQGIFEVIVDLTPQELEVLTNLTWGKDFIDSHLHLAKVKLKWSSSSRVVWTDTLVEFETSIDVKHSLEDKGLMREIVNSVYLTKIGRDILQLILKTN